MKANAPEKIYLSQERDKDGCYVDLMWHKHPYKDMENIQYVRTDAFIEKACDWLSDNLQTIVDVDHPSRHHVESIPVLGSITQTEFLEKFSKEIKYLFD